MVASRPSAAAPVCLVLGALLGLAGSFAPSASLRGIAWGLDGTLLVVAAALLAVHCLRRNLDLVAVGFLVFIAGQTLIASGSAMSLEASSPLFAAGAALWAAALLLISVPRAAALPGLSRLRTDPVRLGMVVQDPCAGNPPDVIYLESEKTTLDRYFPGSLFSLRR
jgi:hypothetical protein